uniref:Peptidase S1 domain-containing protein n=1 Tax=Anopheles maculatus TaxID=74869 RepID=A0A182T2P0_9DIPT
MPDGFREDQFCAFSKNGMDTCRGDSGGPIGVSRFYVGGGWMPLVAGVVSFGTPCVGASTGVYTKVTCCKRKSCLEQHKRKINVNFKNMFSKKRFGLLWKESDRSLWQCGATLIGYQFFLTAASCVTTHRGHPKFVATMSDERTAITGVYVSPLYSPGRSENDIALVKIGQYVNHRVYRPACLWNRQFDAKQMVNPLFIAYGKKAIHSRVNKTVIVAARNGTGCEDPMMHGTDLRCFHNQVPIMPGVCWVSIVL